MAFQAWLQPILTKTHPILAIWLYIAHICFPQAHNSLQLYVTKLKYSLLYKHNLFIQSRLIFAGKLVNKFYQIILLLFLYCIFSVAGRTDLAMKSFSIAHLITLTRSSYGESKRKQCDDRINTISRVLLQILMFVYVSQVLLIVIQIGKQIQFGSMLPDNFPVFNIELNCDFESSDNVYPPFSSLKNIAHSKEGNTTSFIQEQNFTFFSTIGRRNDNLDRCFWLKVQKMKLIGLLDGHCDTKTIDYLQSHLLTRLTKHPQIYIRPQLALTEVFAQMERQVINKFEKGSTAMVVLLFEQTVVVANLGDSKLFGIDDENKIHALTEAHNLGNQQQLMQVINRGGIVLKKGLQYRINGELNLSRSFGDRHLKHCMSSKPDIYLFHRKQFKRWVMASDGFYNAKHIQKRLTLTNLKELREDGTVYLDNASAVFLDF